MLFIFKFEGVLEGTLFILHSKGENRQDGDFSFNQAKDGLLKRPVTIQKMKCMNNSSSYTHSSAKNKERDVFSYYLQCENFT